MRGIGLKAEDLAVEYLENLGYKIVERNFYTPFGEIDIVAFKDEVIHFIEVKYSKKYEAVYRIDKNKLSKIVKSADIFLAKKRLSFDYQFDAIIVSDEIELIENITF